MSFKVNVYGRWTTNDGQRSITIAHPEPSKEQSITLDHLLQRIFYI